MSETTKHIIRWNIAVLGIVATGFAVQLVAHAKIEEAISVGSFSLLPVDVFVGGARKIYMILLVCALYPFAVSFRHHRNIAGAIFFAGTLLNTLEVNILGRVNDFIWLPWFWKGGFDIYYCSVGDVFMTIGIVGFILLLVRRNLKRFRRKTQRTTQP